ncbi:hypothetical protein HII36_33110 [Nonomuraea sp. NN258]|uniref:hypothetical protein n=1 Tax=Nonomuraea antri TaxID=2730852 RepID=UPI001567CF4E|nr:hypothetical protein [Nonomuraea antri]NRQ36640.1 hypothetical protein [Nonomuraea antri]
MSTPSNRVGIDPTLMTQLINEIKRLAQSWPEVDARIGQALSSIGMSLSGPGLLKDVSFQIAQEVPSLQRRLDLIVATQKIGLDKGVVWADESLWVSHSPASGAAAAKSVADELRQLRKNFPFHQQPLSDKTLDTLEKHRNDPYFAIAFAKEMPPGELKEILSTLNSVIDTNISKPNREAAKADRDRLVAALGAILGTASRGVGDMRLPSGYVDQLIAVDANTRRANIDDLLKHGLFDDAFLRDIANKVYDNALRDRGDRDGIMGFGPGLAAALAKNPRVAQDFFTDPARKPLGFLMRDNLWKDRGLAIGRAIEAASTTYRDHTHPRGTSRGYKSAMIASWSILFWSDKKVQSRISNSKMSFARVLSNYISDVNRLSPEAEEKAGVTPLPDADPALPGIQPFGALLSYHGVPRAMTWAFKDPAALKIVAESQGKYSVRVIDAHAAEMAKAINSALESWHKQHPDATAAEVSAKRKEIVYESMTGSLAEEFKARIQRHSETFRSIVDAGNTANINEADAKDESREAFQDAAVDILKMVLTPAGDIIVAGYEFMGKTADETIKFEEGMKARQKAEATLDTTKYLFRDLAADAMMRHGLFGSEEPPREPHPHAYENYAKGSPGDFMKNGRIIPRTWMTPEQDYAYREWLKESSAMRAFSGVDKAVEDGFKAEQPNYPLPGQK